MLFCSQPFLLFFSIVFAAYWLIPWRRVHWTLSVPGCRFFSARAIPIVGDEIRVWLLLGASFYFYADWSKQLALVICVSTLMDYLIGRGMEAAQSQRLRKLLLCTSLFANLGLLAYFKYANFFLRSLEEGLHRLGADASLPVLRVIVPIGISFYTFEAINYTMDVYRRRVPAERNLAHFMLFILFFPHLIAGPIVRARDFLPQIQRPKRWNWARMQLGVQYFLMGLFKKWAIADRMALFCDPVFQHPEEYGSSAVWLATLAFALRIYGDFSGYTDMALGTAHMLGYKLAQNFNMPYLATNFSEFWRRWHISLSSWLRDYLFIPLGGSRGTTLQTCRNLLITMMLGGLWHGLSWMFVGWGMLHGVFLILHRFFQAFCKQRPHWDRVLQSMPGTALRMTVTFLGVCLGWVFFFTASIEAESRMVSPNPSADPVTKVSASYSSVQASLTIVHKLVIPQLGKGPELHNRSFWYTALVVAVCSWLASQGIWKKLAVRLPAPVMGFGYAIVLTIAMVLVPGSGKAFIYFQF